MHQNYSNKIKTVEELCNIIGKPPRKDKVVMCHGTFDIVHPGHIRHLYYAKEKGEVLIASLTSDMFVSKSKDRPYVPQELRASNLAALEMVDYVILDNNPTPIKNILAIKPDLFIKGFEYTKDGFHPKTREEIEAVSSYGGKVTFSPGDVVYSSSHLLAIHKPKITTDKLLSIMDAENVTFDDILSTLHKFKDIKVQVVGDTIVDKYSYCTLLGPTTKTPTLSIKLESSNLFVGGAGIVAKHLRSLGADVAFTTVLGDDDLKDYVLDDLSQWGIKTNAIIDPTRSTTQKERFWAGGYKLLQVDTVDNSIISEKLLTEMYNHVEKGNSDVVVFSDFRHGIFQKETIKLLTEAIDPKAIKIADSQVSNRWGNILDFEGFDIILPNEKEARFALADQDTGIRPLAETLYRNSKAKCLILKLDERGILVYRSASRSLRDFFILDSFVEELVDALGAGDAMLAATSLAFESTRDFAISSIIGSFAAAVACESEGNKPITINEIENKIERMRKQTFL